MNPILAPGPQILGELFISTCLLIVIIAVHGWLLSVASRRFSKSIRRLSADSPDWRIRLVMSATIAAFVMIHLCESVIWSAPIYALGIIRPLRSTFIFVMESYTTLGAGTVVPPAEYQLLGPMIAISGLFTFGWTGSALVFVMNKILRLEAAIGQHAEEQAAAPFGD